MSDCYIDQDGCYVCPERDAEPAVPAHVERKNAIGWRGGANSIQEIDGDLRVLFQASGASGMVVGLRTGRAGSGQLAAIEQGISVRRIAGSYAASVIERGRVTDGPRWVQAEDDIEIRRAGGLVTARVNGSLWFIFKAASHGPKVVGGCLYASGDALPEGARSVAVAPAPAPAPAPPPEVP